MESYDLGEGHMTKLTLILGGLSWKGNSMDAIQI